MVTTAPPNGQPNAAPSGPAHPAQDVDVLIVGAGISGIGAAYYLQREHPDKSYLIVESRGATGGTWDLFRYPGIRSDSDLHTFGYAFKPWCDDDAIAAGDKILDYLRQTSAENGIDARIRFHHSVTAASWSSDDARWTVDVQRGDTDLRIQIRAKWIFCAAGYYRYDEGYTPHFAGRERFGGTIVHPQRWPEDLDYTGKNVVVIGSGATAVTLIPAMAETAGHVTMLQRSPTYIMPVPTQDALANTLRRVLGPKRGYAAARRKNIAQQRLIYQFCQRFPRLARRAIRYLNAKQLPQSYPVDEHFNPTYDPWDQRLCVVPNGDLFQAIRNGTASVVTDQIETFTPAGVRLRSGRELPADIIVTATGLNLQAFGGMALRVDGAPVDVAQTIAYKGTMLSGVPNFAFAIGYTNSSWTLKVGLVSEYFCRLLAHMDTHGYDIACPGVEDAGMATRPLLDFGAGYVRRAIDQLPRQGTSAPWRMSMSYHADAKMLRDTPVCDRQLAFRVASARPQPVPA